MSLMFFQELIESFAFFCCLLCNHFFKHSLNPAFYFFRFFWSKSREETQFFQCEYISYCSSLVARIISNSSGSAEFHHNLPTDTTWCRILFQLLVHTSDYTEICIEFQHPSLTALKKWVSLCTVARCISPHSPILQPPYTMPFFCQQCCSYMKVSTRSIQNDPSRLLL